MELLLNKSRGDALAEIASNHYSHCAPSGKSYVLRHGKVLVVWSIPSNRNLAGFLVEPGASAWELSRVVAPKGTRRNTITEAITGAVEWIKAIESPDVLVGYSDERHRHAAALYISAGWKYSGQSDERRAYRAKDGTLMSRRAFHTGSKGLHKQAIKDRGFEPVFVDGKHRFVLPISMRARSSVAAARKA